ncbi:MAG TPA: TonB-dependent receptor, partial [Candidatus Binatia bacterium]|nr:TonB-dependent receptor [Candidatus Binatia bacterium]
MSLPKNQFRFLHGRSRLALRSLSVVSPNDAARSSSPDALLDPEGGSMMRERLIVWAMLVAACWLASAEADEEAKPVAEIEMDTLVVSATRSPGRVAETAPAITVVTGEELERKQVPTVADALREMPGLTVNESGSQGSVVSVLIRGADADQVLVLIDGVRVNSTTAGAFDFAGLTPENIERIEVLRGWGGTLYGSEAVGGVIQIFTRQGSGPPRGSIQSSGGNASTDREVGEFSGQSGIFAYSGSASHIHTDGFKPENDDYENTVVSGRLDAGLIPDGTARVTFRLGNSEFGNFFSNNFLAAPDPNARQKDQVDFTRAEWSHALNPTLRYRFGFSYAREDEQFDDPADAAETSSLSSDFLSQTYSGDASATLSSFASALESTIGVEYEDQSGDADSTLEDPTFGSSRTAYDKGVGNVAGYTLHQLFFDDRQLVLTGGVRADGNQRFGEAVSPSGGASYAVATTKTRLRATYAQGFKAPSLNQLFFPGFGNPNLDAEHSWEANAGIDQPLAAERVLLSANYFHRHVTDLIVGVPQPDGLFLAQNVGASTVDGAEAILDVEVLQGVRAGGQYTYLNIDASTEGRARKPRHSGAIHVSVERPGLWGGGDRLSADARLLLVGNRLD